MKKIITIGLLFLLTGCFSDAGRGYLTNTCTKEMTSNGLTDKVTYEIYFKENEVINVKVTHQFDGNNDVVSSIKTSFEFQNNYLSNFAEIKMENDSSDTNYTIKYDIDMAKLTDEIKERFNLKEERSKLILELKDEGYTCE